MSNRSLVELNHDFCPRQGEERAYGAALQAFMRSGNPDLLPNGVTFLQMRHHSDPTPTGWMPPQRREAGFECVGWMPEIELWRIVVWVDGPRRFWSVVGESATWSRKNQPTAFLPMPPPPGDPDGEAIPGAAARIRELEEQVEALRSLAHPGGHMKGTRPLVLYFGNDADRAEMIRAIREEKPDMRAVKL